MVSNLRSFIFIGFEILSQIFVRGQDFIHSRPTFFTNKVYRSDLLGDLKVVSVLCCHVDRNYKYLLPLVNESLSKEIKLFVGVVTLHIDFRLVYDWFFE